MQLGGTGLAQDERRIVGIDARTGHDAEATCRLAHEAAQQGDVKLFLLSADASAKTEKEIRFFAGALPVRKLPFDMDTLKYYFRKRTAVFGVCEDGFAAKLLLLLPESEE